MTLADVGGPLRAPTPNYIVYTVCHKFTRCRMRKLKHTWPKTERAQNMLFLAQLLQELVDDYSWDSYRVYALDSVSRLREAIIVCEDIQRNRIPKIALKPVLEELIWSLQGDPVIGQIFDFDINHFIAEIRNEGLVVRDLMRRLRYLEATLEKLYKGTLEKSITTNLKDGGSRVRLRKMAQTYCSHLVNRGFNKNYIRDKVMESFFSQDFKRVDTKIAQKFFENFSDSEHKWKVYCKLDGRFAEVLHDIFDFKVISRKKEIPSSLMKDRPDYFRRGSKQNFVIMELEGIQDEEAARSLAESYLNLGRSILLAVRSEIKPTYDNHMYVVRDSSRRGTVRASPLLPLNRQLRMSSVMARRRVFDISFSVLTKFNRQSQSRFVRSLNTQSLARSSKSIENQLVSLWSAVEVLLSEPTRATSRISHYERLLVPCICRGYVRRNIHALFLDLNRIVENELFKILQCEELGNNHEEKLAAILVLQGRQNLRIDLLNLCNEYPLALHRIWELNKKLSSPNTLRTFLGNHARLVSWQIHRIYRARNNLVHTGLTLPFLDTLIMNLDEYYRVALDSILEVGGADDKVSSIDQVVSDIGVEFELSLSALGVEDKKGEYSSEEDLLKILSL